MSLNQKFNSLQKKLQIGPRDRKQYCIGFATGLAEKVHIGACRAAMVRPLLADAGWMITACSIIAKHYRLKFHVIRRAKCCELWFAHDKATVNTIKDAEAGELGYRNRLRAHLCGIPPSEIIDDYPIAD